MLIATFTKKNGTRSSEQESNRAGCILLIYQRQGMERGPTRMCSPYSVLGTPFRSLLFAPFVRLEKRRHLGNNTAPTAICSACLDETCSRGRRQLDGAPGVGERPLLFDAAPDSWVPVLKSPPTPEVQRATSARSKEHREGKNGQQFRTVEMPESFHPVRHGGIECRCQGWPGPSGLFRDPCVRKLLRTAACQGQRN